MQRSSLGGSNSKVQRNGGSTVNLRGQKTSHIHQWRLRLNDPRWYKTRYLLKHEQQQPEIGYVPFKGEKGRGLMMPEINDYQLILIKEFKEVMRVAYSQVLYSIVESKLRLFLMTAYPDALEKRKKGIGGIYFLMSTSAYLKKPGRLNMNI